MPFLKYAHTLVRAFCTWSTWPLVPKIETNHANNCLLDHTSSVFLKCCLLSEIWYNLVGCNLKYTIIISLFQIIQLMSRLRLSIFLLVLGCDLFSEINFCTTTNVSAHINKNIYFIFMYFGMTSYEYFYISNNNTNSYLRIIRSLKNDWSILIWQ